MKQILPVLSVLGLLSAGGAVTWSVLSRPADTVITREVADSFDLQTGPAPGRREVLRDAVASTPAPVPASSLTRPIAAPDMVLSPNPVSVPARSAAPSSPRARVTAKAETWARKHPLLAGLIAKPAAVLMRRSALGSARSLRAFLADPKKVDAYLNSPLVRVALNSPTVAKTVLGNPAVIRAFLATPAMSDPRAVRELVGSPMLRKMLDCPAIQEALGDPVVMRRMMADTKTILWLAQHPQAADAITRAAPALGGALSARR